MEDDEFDHDEAEENRGVSGKNNPKGGKRLYKKREVRKEAAEDRARDEHLMRGGMSARKDYDRPPAKKLSNKELGIKPGKTWVQKQMEKNKKK
jgi:hypothetical protein